jgi:monovalent cation:H+ antiporter-2, CPA2 family
VSATRSRELFTLTILVLALGIAVGSAKLFGASMALGAFLAGMVVGTSDFSHRAASEALPMRDAFAVLFFVSVGMLFDPKHLLEAPGLVAATLAIILVGKPIAALGIVLLLRYPLRVGLAVAVALAQIGEFSFILATLGRELGLLADSANNALVAAAIVSITLNPLLYRSVSRVETWLSQESWFSRLLTPRTDARVLNIAPMAEPPGTKPHRAIVVGYGPVGRTVTRLLRDSEIEPVVIELNLETVRQLRGMGIEAIYGDASQRQTLAHAGARQAISLILSTAGMPNSQELIRIVREFNPRIRVFARSVHLREAAALRRAGADVVFSKEGEVALAMTEFILRQLGATPEQMDRERDRIRHELFGGAHFEGPHRHTHSEHCRSFRERRPAGTFRRALAATATDWHGHLAHAPAQGGTRMP